jgi:AraC-like DNA-binding protein
MRLQTLHRVRLPNQSVRIMRDVLSGAGIETDGVFRAADLAPEIVERPGATVSGVQELAFQRAFVAVTAGRHDLWLKTGASYSLLTLGGVGLAAMTASTMDMLATTLDDFADFTYWLDTVREVRDQAGAVVGRETVSRDVPNDLHEFTVYRNLGMSTRLLSEVWQRATPPLTAVEVPLRVLPFDRFPLTGTPVRRGSNTRWLWEPEMIGAPSPSHNELLHQWYRRQCEDSASELAAEVTIADQVRDILSSSVKSPPTIHRVADELHISVRSLQRMLHIEGFTYRDLQQDAQARAAKHMLESTRLGVGEVGRRLGYRDTANFSAAFRSWTGLTPTEWRAADAIRHSAQQAA